MFPFTSLLSSLPSSCNVTIHNPIPSPPSLSIVHFPATHSIFLVYHSIFFPLPHPSTCLHRHTRGCLSPQVEGRDSTLFL